MRRFFRRYIRAMAERSPAGSPSRCMPVSRARWTRTGSSLGGKRPAVSLVGHRLGEMPAAEEGDLTGRGVAQNEDGAQHPGLPKGDALSQTGHPEGPHPVPPQAAGHRHRPVAVAVRFDHRHQRAAGGQGGAEGAGVVPQGVRSSSFQARPPGAGRRGAGRPAPGRRTGVSAATAQKWARLFWMSRASSPVSFAAPAPARCSGVEEVDQQGQPAGGAVLPPAAI